LGGIETNFLKEEVPENVRFQTNAESQNKDVNGEGGRE